MKVELGARLFGDRNAHFWILGFLQRALDGRFFMSVSSHNSGDYNYWRAQAPKAVLAALDAVLDTTVAYEAVTKLKSILVDSVQASDWSKLILTPHDALSMLDSPFKLMMENARFDRAFFLSALTAPERQLIEKLELQDRLLFFPGGGNGELHQLILESVATKDHRSVTHAVFFDSDARVPNRPSETARALGRDCARLGLIFHCLARRAIENYLPKGAHYDHLNMLTRKQRDKRRKRVDAFWTMDDSQRFHFHTKVGWAASTGADEQALFANLTDVARRALEFGISGALSDHYRVADADRLRDQLQRDRGIHELRPFINAILQIVRIPNG